MPNVDELQFEKDFHAPILNELPSKEYGIMYDVEDTFWWYVGMRLNLLKLLKRYWNWNETPQPNVLDAGCGTGAILQGLSNGFGHQIPAVKPTGLDLSAEALGFSQKRGNNFPLVKGSITNLPFTNNSFDILISFDVLSYVKDPSPGFREISRVVKHGGLVILNLPAYQFLYSEHDLAVNTVKRFHKAEIASLLSESGLKPVRMSYLNTLLFPPAAIIRLGKKGILKTRRSKEVHSDLTQPHPLVNNFLRWTMAREATILGKTNLNLPFGLSFIAVAQRI